ncbi:phosphonate ABC transporter, permease protein PhnE [Vagococcus sp.]|uniref:phosphonate ABC transporter, permease protein PhnE n=1 Tax=Vagococcus sp. TaxID=1933889 RepID=UPI003F9D461C
MKLFKSTPWTLDDGTVIEEKKSKTPIYVLIGLVIVYFSIRMTQFDFQRVAENNHQFWTVLFQMFPPNVGYTKTIVSPLLDTIKMSFIGSFLGSLLAIPFAILAAENITKNKVVVQVVRFIFTLLRTLPTLVTALIATYIWGLGTFAGTVAIFIFSFSYIGKQLFEQIETADMGAFEALEALGSSKSKAFIMTIVPQLLPIYLSTVLFNFEGNVRYAAILGYVGAGGIGMILNENIGWREYPKVGMILIILLITVILIESISKYIRKRLT